MLCNLQNSCNLYIQHIIVNYEFSVLKSLIIKYKLYIYFYQKNLKVIHINPCHLHLKYLVHLIHFVIC